MKTLSALILLAAASAACGSSTNNPSQTADVIFVGGDIVTMTTPSRRPTRSR